MKKKILLTVLLLAIITIVTIITTRPYNVTLTGGDISLSVNAFTKMETETSRYSTDEPIVFTFYYGHTVKYPQTYGTIITKLEIFIKELGSTEEIVIDTRIINDLLTEENACDVRSMGYWLFYSSCPNYFELAIDFEQYGVNEGYLSYRITQVLETEDFEDDIEDPNEVISASFVIESGHIKFA